MSDTAANPVVGGIPERGPANSPDAIASRMDSLLGTGPAGEPDEAAQPEPVDSVEDDEPAAQADAPEADEAEDVAETDTDEPDGDDAESDDEQDKAESFDKLDDLARAVAPKDATDEDVADIAELIRTNLRVPVKINGEERQVTLAEALNGYSRTEDYRANNQKLADQQRQFDEVVNHAQTQLRTKLDNLTNLSAALEGQIVSDAQLDQILAEQGSDEYLRAKAHRDRLLSNVEAVKAEAEAASEAGNKRQAAQFQQFLAQQRQVMAQDFPEVSDPKKGPKLMERWHGYLGERGFSEQEVAQLVDARMVRVIDDATKYRELQKAKPEREKKLKSLPKVLKPGKGEAKKPASKSEVARNRLRRSGKVDDAAAAIRAMFPQ